jgi:hypothetical protein
MARYDDLPTNMIAYAAVISCLLLIAIIQATQALCFNMVNTAQEQKLQSSEYTSSKAVISEQLASINGYKKVSVPPEAGPDGKPTGEAPKTLLQIPVDRAIDLILKENKSKPATSVAPGA